LKFNTSDLFEGSEIDKKILNWVFGIFFGIFVILILSVIYFENRRGSCTSSKEEFYLFEYKGRILKTFKAKNHGYPSVLLENGIEKSLIFDYKIWANIYKGDILIKKKNELNFILIRGIDTMRIKETISDCNQFKQ